MILVNPNHKNIAVVGKTSVTEVMPQVNFFDRSTVQIYSRSDNSNKYPNFPFGELSKSIPLRCVLNVFDEIHDLLSIGFANKTGVNQN